MLILAGLLAAPMARAGIGAEISIANDYRYRGVSLTDGRPTALVGLDLDARSGLYASGLAAIAPDPNDRLVASAERVVGGLARPIGAGTTLDGGLAVTTVRAPSSGAVHAAPEVYLGLRRGGLALYASYSPDYFARGAQTLYVETSASYRLSERLRLFARAGLLSQVAGEPYSAGVRADFGVGAATHLAGFGLRAEVTSVSPTALRAGGPRTAVAVTLTRAF